MSWAEIKKAVNDDISVPLNKAIGEYYYNGQKVKSIKNRILTSSLNNPESYSQGNSAGIFYNGKLWYGQNNGQIGRVFDGETWVALNGMGGAKVTFGSGCAWFISGGKMYATGQSSSSWNQYAVKYDEMNEVFNSDDIISLSINVAVGNAVCMDEENDYTYIFAGGGLNSYTILHNGQFVRSTSITISNNAVNGSAAVFYHGQVHLIGGANAGSRHYVKESAVESDVWRALDPLPFLSNGSSAFVMNDKIYLVGGVPSNTKSFYSYDETNGWVAEENLPFPASTSSLSVLDEQGKAHTLIGQDHFVFDGERWDNKIIVDNIITTYELMDGTIVP